MAEDKTKATIGCLLMLPIVVILLTITAFAVVVIAIENPFIAAWIVLCTAGAVGYVMFIQAAEPK